MFQKTISSYITKHTCMHARARTRTHAHTHTHKTSHSLRNFERNSAKNNKQKPYHQNTAKTHSSTLGCISVLLNRIFLPHSY